MAQFRQAEWNPECVSPLARVDPGKDAAIRVSDALVAVFVALDALAMSMDADPTMGSLLILRVDWAK